MTARETRITLLCRHSRESGNPSSLRHITAVLRARAVLIGRGPGGQIATNLYRIDNPVPQRDDRVAAYDLGQWRRATAETVPHEQCGYFFSLSIFFSNLAFSFSRLASASSSRGVLFFAPLGRPMAVFQLWKIQ